MKVFDSPVIVVVAMIIITAVIILAFMNRKDMIKKAALYAVATAEEAWGSKMGKVKFAEVYSYLQTEYPIITFFFTEKQLTSIIEDALANLKEILATKEAKEKAIVMETKKKITGDPSVEIK